MSIIETRVQEIRLEQRSMSSSSSFIESGSRHHAYSRKEKSLGLLCTKFVDLYDRDGIETVGLDDAARRLGVERRRIYDIVNVLESVGVLTRKAKNRYSWIGFPGIPKALAELKAEALSEMSCPPMDDFCIKIMDGDVDDKSVDQNEDFGEEKLIQNFSASSTDAPLSQTLSASSMDAPLSQTLSASSVEAPLRARPVSDNRKEKSLGLLTQNFVKLLLTTRAETVSLDEAARLLLGDGHDLTIMRTKVRRLYDIANVLSSLSLIEKIQHADTRKPAFRWVGINEKLEKGVTVAIPPASNQWNKRAFGTDITNVDYKRTRLGSSVDRKPSIQRNVVKECNLTAQKQLQGSKGSYVFGPFSPTVVTKQDSDDEEKREKKDHDWEALAETFRPQYHNQALSDLFSHYMEAWKSWYVQVAEGSSSSK